jgi:hypothetical protein
MSDIKKQALKNGNAMLILVLNDLVTKNSLCGVDGVFGPDVNHIAAANVLAIAGVYEKMGERQYKINDDVLDDMLQRLLDAGYSDLIDQVEAKNSELEG